ncbi:hypothetical protein LOC67_07940 [Stieleria sp. JC731]|nr:hypothetical protein [Stieleria sp. JC731]MCC9600488.1 hypothetical protein [Stieleria sp. JC731]
MIAYSGRACTEVEGGMQQRWGIRSPATNMFFCEGQLDKAEQAGNQVLGA